MLTKFINVISFGFICVLFSASPAAARRSKPAAIEREHRAVNDLISRWVKAYQDLDARRLAALEVPDVETVDRFGVFRLLSGRNENEKLWSDAFEMVARNKARSAIKINHIQFLRPDVALVQVSWQFAEGILLTDGARIPPFSQVDTFVLLKSHGEWLVAAHNMQETKPQARRCCDPRVDCTCFLILSAMGRAASGKAFWRRLSEFLPPTLGRGCQQTGRTTDKNWHQRGWEVGVNR